MEPPIALPTLTVKSEADNDASIALLNNTHRMWRPRATVGSRVLIGDLSKTDRGRWCTSREHAQIGNGGAVGELVRCGARWSLVRFVLKDELTAKKMIELNTSGLPSQLTSIPAEGHLATPPSTDTNNKSSSLFREATAASAVEVHLTVPSASVLTVVEFIVEQAGLFKTMQEMMTGGRFAEAAALISAVTSTVDKTASAALLGSELRGNGTDEEARNAQRLQSFMLLCGYDTTSCRYRPHVAVLHTMHGLVRLFNKEYAKAFDCATESLACDPTNLESYTLAASALLCMNRLDEALVVVDACATNNSVLSPEFLHIAMGIRAAKFYQQSLRNAALDVSPIPLEDVMKHARSTSATANRALTALAQTVLSPSAVEECFATPDANATWYPHTLLRCMALRASSEEQTRRDRGVILTERAAVLVASLGTATPNPSMCGYCGFVLTPKEEVIRAAEQVHPAFVHAMRRQYPACMPVSCEGRGCKMQFCSEVCRSRAYSAFHELECDLPDCWRAPTAESPAALRGQISDFLSGSSPRNGRRTSDVVFMDGMGGASLLPSPAFPAAPADEPMSWPRRWSVAYSNQAHRGSIATDPSALNASGSPVRRPYREGSVSQRVLAARRTSATVQNVTDVIGALRTKTQELHNEVQAGIFAKASAATRNAMLLFSRCISSVLSLFFPTSAAWEGNQRLQRQRNVSARKQTATKSAVLKDVIESCEARGLRSSGESTEADRRDANGLAIAEELLQRLHIPFFGVAVTHTPIKRSDIDGVINTGRRGTLSNASSLMSPSNQGEPQIRTSLNASEALCRVAEYCKEISRIIVERCNNMSVAVSATRPTNGSDQMSGIGSGDGSSRATTPASPFQAFRRVSTVWTVDDDETLSALANTADHGEDATVWTVGRLLSFIGTDPFVRLLWELCLTSHTTIRLCAPSMAVGASDMSSSASPWSRFCVSQRCYVSVIAPVLSVVTDRQFTTPPPGSTDGGNGEGVSSSRFRHTPMLSRFQSALSLGDLKSSSRGQLSMSSQPSVCEGPLQDNETSNSDDLSSLRVLEGDATEFAELQQQLENGGNTFIDTHEIAMCLPGNRTIVLKSLGSVTARDVLRLVNE